MPARTTPHPLQIQRQQPREDHLVGHLRAVVLPAIGRRDCHVQGLVRVVEPGGALVVEIGQGPGLEVLLPAWLRDYPVGEVRGNLRHPLHQFSRVEPVLPLVIQTMGCLGNGQGHWAPLRVYRGQDDAILQGFDRASGVGGRQVLGKGEGLEGSRRGVAWPIFQAGA